MEKKKKILEDVFGQLTEGQREILECGFPFFINRLELFTSYPQFKSFMTQLLTDYACFSPHEKSMAIADAFHQAKSIVDKYELKKARDVNVNE